MDPWGVSANKLLTENIQQINFCGLFSAKEMHIYTVINESAMKVFFNIPKLLNSEDEHRVCSDRPQSKA